MSISPNDLLRLQHMRDAAYEVVEFTAAASRADLDDDLKLLRALSMSTGTIGEAASHISAQVREMHPDIPWQQIIAMRNFLFHEYFRVDPQILWDTATSSVPTLIPQLEAVISSASS